MNWEDKTILYVDDDADDREMLGDAVRNVAPEVKVTYAENGLQALELLEQKRAAQTLPCLIVLDLNMPFLDGRQTYERIKTDPLLNSIPLVILSSGENPSDKALFKREGISYFTKPIEFAAMKNIASQMVTYCD